MKIKELTFHDLTHNWKIDAAQFHDNLNLLVGVSGAGKTTLIRAIDTVFSTSRSESKLGHVAWKLQFLSQGTAYCWELETGVVAGNSFTDLTEQYTIIFEKLMRFNNSMESQEIFQREATYVRMNGQKVPKLKRAESLISLFSEEDIIAPVYLDFLKLSHREESLKAFYPITDLMACMENIRSISKDSYFSELLQYASTEFPGIMKLFIIQKNDPSLLEQIKATYRDMFPQVEDLRIRARPNQSGEDSTFLEIREVQQKEWTPQTDISSGMFRALMLVVNILAAPDGTVIAIDEFENSLGVNCLTEVTNLILDHCHRLQFIITSHHPYIINNIPWQNWSIVSREGNLIKVRHAPDIAELQTGSNLDKFSQLIDFLDSQEEN